MKIRGEKSLPTKNLVNLREKSHRPRINPAFPAKVRKADGNVIPNFIKTLKTLETAWFQRFLRLWDGKKEEMRIDDFAEKLVKIWYESW